MRALLGVDRNNLQGHRRESVFRPTDRYFANSVGPISEDVYSREVGYSSYTFKLYYLCRPVGQDAEVVDVCLQAKRNGAAEKRFVSRLLHSHGNGARKIVTEKLPNCGGLPLGA